MIGAWVARFRPDSTSRRTRWHLVESEVAERVVTRCGREMNLRQRGGELRPQSAVADAPVLGDDRCHYCLGVV